MSTYDQHDLFSFDFNPAPEPERPIPFRLPKEGDRVLVSSLQQRGRIDYLDQRNLFHDHMYPVQVILDEPYEDTRLYRTSIGDLAEV